MIEEKLKTVLDTLGYSVHPLRKPQNKPFPVIIYKRISTEKSRTQSGSVDLKKARFQIDVYSSTYQDAKTIGKAVEDLLECNTSSWTLSTVIDSMDMEEDNVYRVKIETYIFDTEN